MFFEEKTTHPDLILVVAEKNSVLKNEELVFVREKTSGRY